MSAIKNFLRFLNGFRKLFLCFLGVLTISIFDVILLIVFIVGWSLDTLVVSGQQLTDLFIASFKYDAAIIGAYMAANVCVKGMDRIKEWLAKKR